MKKRTIHFLFFFALLAIGFTACQNDAKDLTAPQAETLELPDQSYNYANIEYPAHFADVSFFDNTPFDNQITDAGATLGRVLFYDKKLSLNNTVSCASCHDQKAAFADPVAFSTGYEGQLTSRNSLSIVNPKFSNSYFWDSRTRTLEEQVLQPISNHIEMGLEDMDKLAGKLAKINYYPDLFEAAYGSSEVTPEKIAKAMAQFLRSFSCINSKYDKGFDGGHDNLSASEKLGMELFFSERTQCGNCHRSVNFYYGSSVNIGLDLDYEDEGVGQGRFRIPSLRNVGVSQPYMHDGRFETLEEVVEHYNSGVKAHQSLDWRLRDENGAPKKLNLTAAEKQGLVDFLKALTDYEFINDPKYSNPFR